MQEPLKAVIFDMDGVLINSEQLWRRAMIKGFGEYHMFLTEEDCRKTMGMRFGEVIHLWLQHFKLVHLSAPLIEERVMNLLLDLIEKEGAYIAGIPEIIGFCRQKSLPMGLATSSSRLLMNAVLTKLGLHTTLQVTVSAEYLKHGKPHPEVFLICAEKLGVLPSECLVIEDSINGIIAAKAAQMKVVAVPDEEHADLKQFVLADYKFSSMKEVLPLIRILFP
ncbi:MAG: hexitol phosphatase HxpB [bacterium]|nr:hexitol phosphatase HxpB [bacterium]